jgi:hypothetical protein
LLNDARHGAAQVPSAVKDRHDDANNRPHGQFSA